jgi:hypothetical protein
MPSLNSGHHRARDTRLNRTVAVKVLPPQLSENPEMRQRFEREAQTLAGLSHPHICPIFDVGHQHGIDYLVMEYLEGHTLAQRRTSRAHCGVGRLRLGRATAQRFIESDVGLQKKTGAVADLMALPLTGDRKPFAVAETPFSENHAQISPDGKWIAFNSDETGTQQIYIKPFPSGSGKWQASTTGGIFPRWQRDGRSLFLYGERGRWENDDRRS